jgi:hypothetical protein
MFKLSKRFWPLKTEILFLYFKLYSDTERKEDEEELAVINKWVYSIIEDLKHINSHFKDSVNSMKFM